jgi:hypothetical protein
LESSSRLDSVLKLKALTQQPNLTADIHRAGED